MKIITGFPPNFKAINKKFNIRNKPVIFSWGTIIYNPYKIEIPPELIAHEEVHGKAQEEMGVETWWDLYLKDTLFRLNEELAAHRAEYKYYPETMHQQQRMEKLEAIARRLSGPMYGSMISYDKAIERIMG